MTTLNFVSLFAGIGGFDLGLERTGKFTCVGQVEIDKHATAVLAHHWPEVPRHDDVTTAISTGWTDDVLRSAGRVDLVCGGFPCQPFSVAGKRLGRDDLRGNLFWNALAVAQALKARYVLMENVPGLLTADGGGTFNEILHDLGDAGYGHREWRVLDSQFFGVPQRRKRVFILGVATEHSSGFGVGEVLSEPAGLSWHPRPFSEAGQDAAGDVEGGAGEGRGRVLADSGVVQSLTQGLGSGGPDAQHAQAGWLIPQVDGQPWMTGPITGTLNPGAHPGSYNGQDAYANLLAVHGPRPEGVEVYP